MPFMLREALADGVPGTIRTLQQMKTVAYGPQGRGSVIVRQTAERIIADIPERDKHGEIGAILSFVRRIRYTSDPVGIELVKTPERLLRELGEGRALGDCDDHVMLMAALLLSIGIPVRFVIVGREPEERYSHIYLEAWDGRQWIPADPIVKNRPLGWAPDRVSHRRRMVV